MKPPEEADFRLLSPEQIASIKARVESWLGPEPDETNMEGVDRMAAWLERRVAFQVIMSAMIAEGDILLPGRSGINILARALQNFGKQAEQLLSVIKGKEEERGNRRS